MQRKKVSKGQTYQVIDFPIRGEHDSENPVPHSIDKLQPFL